MTDEQIAILAKVDEILIGKFNHNSYTFCASGYTMMKQKLCLHIFMPKVDYNVLFLEFSNVWDAFREYFKDTLDDIFANSNDISEKCFESSFNTLLTSFPNGATQENCLAYNENRNLNFAPMASRKNNLVTNQ